MKSWPFNGKLCTNKMCTSQFPRVNTIYFAVFMFDNLSIAHNETVS
jgi:hypothetical protein